MIRIQRVIRQPSELPTAAQVLSTGGQAAGVALPHELAEIARPSDRMEPRERSALARQIEEQLVSLRPHVAALDAARSLAEPGACAVVAGQQPGFLASPLFSIYKALHALRLARLLRERWSVPVVAVFWNHADDHDIAEVHHAYLVNRNLDLQKISLPELSSGRQPFSNIILTEEKHHLAAIRALLGQTLEGMPFAERALEMLAPRAGESLARAFTRGLTELLGRAGLVVLEPDWIRAQMSAHLSRIVASEPLRPLERGADRLRALDLEPAIEPARAALVYAHEPPGRRALRAGGDGFRFDGESGSRTAAELSAEIVQDPLGWSPGALLRPIVQDLCLPVAAYVGGWGELAYHAELTELRAQVGAPATPFVPRVSCTLVDPECRVSLAKLGVDIDLVLGAKEAFAVDVSLPRAPDVIDKLRAITEDAAKEIEALRGGLSELDPVLVSQLKRTADQVRSAGSWMAEKAERVHQNKSGKGRRHLRRLNNWLRPNAEPQERVLGPLPFVARFGEEWPLELLDEIDPFGVEHLVVHLGPDFEGDAA